MLTITPNSRQEEGKRNVALLLELLFIRKAKAFPGSPAAGSAVSHGPELHLIVMPQLQGEAGKAGICISSLPLWCAVARRQGVGMAIGRLCIRYTVYHNSYSKVKFA